MQLPSDWTDLLKAFAGSKVKFLLIGGHAFMYYAEPRYTKDLDLWVDCSPENAQRVFQALAAFGAPLAGISAEEFEVPGMVYHFGRPPLRVDILTSVTGVNFEEAWIRRVPATYRGQDVFLISKQDLIANKRATGRPQDIFDADRLEKS